MVSMISVISLWTGFFHFFFNILKLGSNMHYTESWMSLQSVTWFLLCILPALLPPALQTNIERSTLKTREGGGCHIETKTWHQTKPDDITGEITGAGRASGGSRFYQLVSCSMSRLKQDIYKNVGLGTLWSWSSWSTCVIKDEEISISSVSNAHLKLKLFNSIFYWNYYVEVVTCMLT